MFKTNDSFGKLTGLFILVVIVSLCSTTATGWSQEEGVGLGVILGEPTGVSFKTWLSKTQAIDAAAAWSFGNKSAFHLHADYLLHSWSLIRVDRSNIPIYYGIGARLKFEDDNRFGVRFPVGITVFIREAPIDFFLEIVPILNLAPATDFDLNAAIGARYYF